MKINGHKRNVQKKQRTLADVRNERARAEKAAQKAKKETVPVGQHQEYSQQAAEAVIPQHVDAEVQAQRLEAQKARREAQKAEKEARKNSRFGGKTIFDKKTGEYIAKPVEEVKAESLAKKAKGSRFNFSGLGKYAKKGGKIGLVIGIAAGVAALAKWGYDKLFGSDESKETTPEVKTQAPTEKKAPVTPAAPKTKAEDKAPEKEKTEDKKTETNKGAEKPKSEKTKKQSPAPKTVVPTPAPKADAPDKADKAEETDKTEETDKAPEAEKQETEKEVHSVKRGDNVWNIAKKHLKDLNNGDKPTNAEILKHTKEIMEWNNLEFEADGKRVIIKPGDQLKLTA